MYPNPATTGMTLSVGSDALLNTPAMLFDCSGRLISEQVITGRQEFIDLHNRPSGIYLLRLANNETLIIIKE